MEEGGDDEEKLEEFKISSLIEITSNNPSDKIHTQEMIVSYAGGSIYETEYGIVQSDGSLGEFTSLFDAEDGIVRLTYTPDSSVTSVNIRVFATLIG